MLIQDIYGEFGEIKKSILKIKFLLCFNDKNCCSEHQLKSNLKICTTVFKLLFIPPYTICFLNVPSFFYSNYIQCFD